MGRTFFPELSESIPASHPHPPKTFYKVSVGLEAWGNKYTSVVKVQMVYDGQVSGRKSPSYPLDSDDVKRVADVAKKLHERHSKKYNKSWK